MSKSFLLFVLAVAISSTFVVVESRLNIHLEAVFEREQESDSRETDSDASEADAIQFGATTRIVGGTEADPGEYPYFGKFSKCARSGAFDLIRFDSIQNNPIEFDSIRFDSISHTLPSFVETQNKN